MKFRKRYIIYVIRTICAGIICLVLVLGVKFFLGFKSGTMTVSEQESVYLISDKKVSKVKVPEIRLPHAKNTGTKIGVLLGRKDEKNYELNKDYVCALQKAGATNIRLLSYNNVVEQAKDLSGIVLVGGAFSFPPNGKKNLVKRKKYNRFYAYENLIRFAHKEKLPVMGICAGFQMMIGLMNPGKVNLIAIDTLPYFLVHTEERHIRPHSVAFTNGSRLLQLLGHKVDVNSVHRRGILFSDLRNLEDVIPTAVSPDGLAEEVKFPKHPNWMAVQFHPEVLACDGDEKMQGIFKLFMQDADNYEQNKAKTADISKEP